METSLQNIMNETIWVAHSLFDRGKTSGSTANISFRYKDMIYISRTGSCFGRLSGDDFAILQDRDGKPEIISENKPSKEFPLHWMIYQNDPAVNAVIHTHSFYSVLWSCLRHDEQTDLIPSYTPYLRMKVRKIKLVGYAEPGSEKLFHIFSDSVEKDCAYLMQNHGLIVGGKNMMDAFYKCEEIEESIKVAWYLRNEKENTILLPGNE